MTSANAFPATPPETWNWLYVCVVRTLALLSSDVDVGAARVERPRARKRKAALRGAVYIVMIMFLLVVVQGLT